MDEQRAWLKARRKRRLRILAVMLSVCVLFTTYPDIPATLSVFASEEQAQAEGRYISGFTVLSDEIREQTVPVGTELAELSLPDTLEAVVTEQPSEEGEPSDSGQENTEENKDTDAGEETGDEQDTQPEKDGESEETDGKAAAGDEETADTEEEENTEESAPAEEQRESAVSQETHTVTMQEYHAENVISVQTLENTQTEKQEETVAIDGVAWQSEPEYDGSMEGTYTFTAILPEGYSLAEDVSLPQITVTVIESESGTDFVIQTLLDRIAALPDAQEYREKEPDIDSWEGDEEDYEEAYAAWMEGLQDYAKEALAILEEIGKLTEEEQALLPQEALEKLAAWAKIAKTLSESTMVMAAADGSHGDHSGWTEVTNSTTTLTAGKKYYLTGDVTVSDEIQVTTGREVTLCLNGHALRRSTFGDETKWVIMVADGATLNVYDCADGGKGTIESASYYNTNKGGGISVAGTLNVYGGTISGLSGTLGTGAGVCVQSGAVVNLHGGTVKSKNANGVYIASSGMLTMDNEAATVICEATAWPPSQSYFAGIYIEKGAAAKVENGTVSAGTDQANTFSIYVSPGGSLSISGGVVSKLNEYKYGSIYVAKAHFHDSSYSVAANVQISGGTVSAGLGVKSGMSVEVSGGSINGVSLTGGVLEMSGNQKILASDNSNLAGAAISIGRDNFDSAVEKNARGKVRLTGELTNMEPYVVHLSELNPSSAYPLIITEGFGAHMSGKDPAKYFTSNQGYKVVLQDGEAAFRPYIMTFDANGGTCATTTRDFQAGKSVAEAYLLPSEPTREHYTFDGWYTSKTGGKQITEDTKLSGEDMTVYAHWTPVAYDITYDLDGGKLADGETNPATYHIETPAFILKNPVRAGYVFTGWSGTGLTGQTNKTVTVPKGSTGARTYTAHWEKAKYQVTVSTYKDGTLWSGAPAVKLTADNGSSFITNLSAVGDGTYKVYSDNTDTGVTVTVNGGNATARVYYYTVTFYDGNTAYTNQTVLKGKTATKPSNPSKTGYTFAKWVTADGGSTEFSFSAQITAKTSVYAGWTANSYTVTYDGNGNTGGSTADSTHTYGTAKALTSNGFKREYTVTFNPNYTGSSSTDKIAAYTFAGWNTKADGSGTSYNDKASVKNLTGANGATVILYAKWTPASVSCYTPTREGYAFEGWYTDRDCDGSREDSNGAYTPDGDKTLYAKWKDATTPAKPVLQSGVTLPEPEVWTNDQDTIPLTLSDNEGVTKLLVSVDGTPYTEVSGFSGGIGSMMYDYPFVQEGEHTYQFKAEDAARNISVESDPFTIKLDKTKPEIGELTYDNAVHLNRWHWIIGKKSIVIHVPVTDAGSGVTEISYTRTDKDAAGNLNTSSAVTDTATVTNGEAKITIAADFRGTIAISCTDAVGNAADGVTIGKYAGGMIVEDNAPDITILADRNISDTQQTQPGGVAVSEEYYDSTPALIVTVKDDTGNAITAGLATVTYQVEGAAEKSVTVDTSVLQEEVTFAIHASEIPTGITEITVTDTDNAGNTATKPITVKVKGPEKQPDAKIDYRQEELTGLVPGGKYIIDGTAYTADGEGRIPIIEGWFGKSVSIIKKGNGNETTDSTAQDFSIPARPAAPSAPELRTSAENSITLNTITGAQYRLADGTDNWQDSTAFTGLAQKTIYSFKVYYPATDTSFASAESSPAQIATMPTAPTKDKLKIGYAAETFTLTDGIEAFTDAACTTPVTEGSVEDYMGQIVYIRYPEKGIIPASLTTAVSIPARPAKPAPGKEDASYPKATDGAITGLTPGTTYEYRVKEENGNFGAWKAAASGGTKIENLPAGDYEVRVKAVETGNASFRSEAAAVTIGEQPGVKVTFMVDGAEHAVRFTKNGGTLTDIPPIPAKENATGAWCMDEQGTTPAVFTNITADMTVYAFYTTAYTVTLQTGTGYTLSAQPDSESPVKEGGSFTFRFALANGYQKNAGFAVKVNGVKVELTTDDTYTITDIRENKTVTVEGVGKKPGGKPSDGGDKDKDKEDDLRPEPEDPSPRPDDQGPENPSPKPPVTPPAKGTSPAPAPGGTTPAGKQPEGRPGSRPGTRQEQEETGVQNESGGPEKERKPEGTQAQQTEMRLGDGTVIVTVVCEEEKCTATVADTEKVVKAVLTPDQQELVNGGGTIEIRIDVTDISEKVPAQDKEVIESGIEAYREEVPGLVLGMYVDISMFIKLGAGDWNDITETDEPIEVVVNIPEKLLSDNREFYIIRSHNGEYTFMNDLDDAPETITVSTDRFSSYAIAYAETDGTGADSGAKCGLCHICPTFLGICCFIWLAVVIVLALVICFIIWRKKGQEEEKQEK